MGWQKIHNFYGIVLYDIEKDNCLNAVWTNQINSGKISNEIIRKKLKQHTKDEIKKYSVPKGHIADNIDGFYDYCFFDKTTAQGELEIRHIDLNVYQFLWRGTDGNPEGIGYKMNDRQIAVTYWYP